MKLLSFICRGGGAEFHAPCQRFFFGPGGPPGGTSQLQWHFNARKKLKILQGLKFGEVLKKIEKI